MAIQMFDILVVGAGMTGLVCATHLAQKGFHVGLVERNSLDFSKKTTRFDGRVSAIAYGSKYYLNGLGLWDTDSLEAQPIDDIVVHEAGGFGSIHYDHMQVSDEPLGHIVENQKLKRFLIAKARHTKNLTICSGVKLTNIKQDAHQAILIADSGEKFIAPLVVAADGKFSWLRQQIGISQHHADYKQTAIVATIAHSQPHHAIAVERFFDSGPFAVLPIRNNRSSLVWVEPSLIAESLLALSEDQLLQALKEKMQGYLGEISFSGERWSYPLTLNWSRAMHLGRVALLGDAAHSIHPIAGQGVNLGFRDAKDLVELVSQQAQLGLDVGAASVLNAYQSQRLPDILALVAATDGINRLFSNSQPLISLVRNIGFAAVSKTPAIRKSIMAYAMGLVER